MPSATSSASIPSMQVTKIYIYPIKSCRAYEATSAHLDRHGFKHDRTFMLLARQPTGSLKNMHVSEYAELVLFFCSAPNSTTAPSTTISFKPPKGSGKEERSIDLLLEPDTSSLEQLDVKMHDSPTKAFNMGDRYNAFFSTCLGYEVVLVYLGPNLRPVLMSTLSNSPPTGSENTASNGWLSSLTSTVSGLLGTEKEEDKITFADCAPYLIVSEKSIEDVTSRLPEGEQMDITKFRPNIIVSGASEAWEEDLWAELEIESENGKSKVHCLHNCARCTSINVDYETGRPGQGESGKILKMLSKDRRIDKGMKYSPVFGRYSFVDKACEGSSISVGDEVRVTRRNEQNTRFDWYGLATK